MRCIALAHSGLAVLLGVLLKGTEGLLLNEAGGSCGLSSLYCKLVPYACSIEACLVVELAVEGVFTWFVPITFSMKLCDRMLNFLSSDR